MKNKSYCLYGAEMIGPLVVLRSSRLSDEDIGKYDKDGSIRKMVDLDGRWMGDCPCGCGTRLVVKGERMTDPTEDEIQYFAEGLGVEL